MPRRPSHFEQGLFPCEAEIARRLSQDPIALMANTIVLASNGLSYCGLDI